MRVLRNLGMELAWRTIQTFGGMGERERLRRWLVRTPWWINGHLRLASVELSLAERNLASGIAAELLRGVKASIAAARVLQEGGAPTSSVQLERLEERLAKALSGV